MIKIINFTMCLVLSMCLFIVLVLTGNAHTAPTSLWTSQAPTTYGDGHDGSVELGVRFSVDTPGSITALKFWKSPLAPTYSHTGTLWTGLGAQLATIGYTSESTSGWQIQVLNAPITLTPNSTYVASVHTIGYGATSHYFDSPFDISPLHARQAGGVYTYGNNTIFPTSIYNNSNYWVDFVFSPNSASTPTNTPTSTPISTSTPTPTATPTSTYNSPYLCTEIIGFSQTDQWYNGGFIQNVPDPTHYQLRFFSGGSIDQWAAGSSFPGWSNTYLTSHCANGGNSPDRIIMTVAAMVYQNDPVWWSNQIGLTVNYIHSIYDPSVHVLYLQPVVTGPASSLCKTNDPLAQFGYNRATYNWPFIESGINNNLTSTVLHGAYPQVSQCSDYGDWAGHLYDTTVLNHIGTGVANFYTLTR